MKLLLDIAVVDFSAKGHMRGILWAKASQIDFINFQLVLHEKLRSISLPIDTILCHDLICKYLNHSNAINRPHTLIFFQKQESVFIQK
jgi:hypothetical protein